MRRPIPPDDLLESPFFILRPAPEVWEWLQAEILAESGSIHNEEHVHLIDAEIRVMWASAAFTKKGRTMVGQAEQVAFRAGGWQKARMEQQMRDWFGELPAFIITLAADYCAQCSDAEFCALVEHELWHILSWPEGDLRTIAPAGNTPLLKRPFVHGAWDCWQVCADWYKREWGWSSKPSSARTAGGKTRPGRASTSRPTKPPVSTVSTSRSAAT